MSRCRAERREALEGLLRQFRPIITRTVGRIAGVGPDVEDAVQEAVVAVVRSMARFRGDCQLRTWVIGIAARVALRDAVRRRRQAQMTLSLADQPASHNPPESPHEGTLRHEFRAQLALAVGKLPPERRAVVVLRHGEGLDLSEIAVALDIPVGTVKSRLHLARRELRELMRPYLSDECDER